VAIKGLKEPSVTKTASTHLLEPLDTEGKRYYVIDAAREVFAADVDWDTAHRKKEQVAGNLWSRTPAIHEMPTDPARAALIVAAAGRSTRGKTNGAAKTPPQPAATVSADVVAEQAPEPAPLPAPPMPADLAEDGDAPLPPDPLAEELEAAPVEDIVGGDDDDLSGLDDL
jgi:hypothetical protein